MNRTLNRKSHRNARYIDVSESAAAVF
jgi:hypothetical protein